MSSLPAQPLVHRSWLARGTYYPNPWSRDGWSILYESVVTFTRVALSKDSTGGFAGGSTNDYLTTTAHIDLEESDTLFGSPLQPLIRRYYTIYLDTPADTNLIPRKADRVRFTDALGTSIEMPVRKVSVAENYAGHLEIETEDIT